MRDARKDPGLAQPVPGRLTAGPADAADAFRAKAAEVAEILQDHMTVRFIVVDGRGIAAEG